MWLSKRSADTSDPLRCTHPLVLHADGTHECEGEHRCHADELVHEWLLPCHELGCGCTGEEHDLVLSYATAA